MSYLNHPQALKVSNQHGGIPSKIFDDGPISPGYVQLGNGNIAFEPTVEAKDNLHYEMVSLGHAR